LLGHVGNEVVVCLPDSCQEQDTLTQDLAAGRLRGTVEWSWVLDHAPAGSVIVDVGAHLGAFSLMAADRGHDVIAVEANEVLATLLARSAQVNGFDRLVVVPAAASDRPGTVAFDPAGPWGSVHVDSTSATEVVSRRLDDIVDESLAQLGRPRSDVALVKVDVEGCEIPALDGMGWLLDDDRIDVLIEANGPEQLRHGQSVARLFSKLSATGRQMFRPLDGGLRPASAVMQVDAVCDYLATTHPQGPVIRPLSHAALLSGLELTALSQSVTDREWAAHVLDQLPTPDRSSQRTALLAWRLCHDVSEQVRTAVHRAPLDETRALAATARFICRPLSPPPSEVPLHATRRTTGWGTLPALDGANLRVCLPGEIDAADPIAGSVFRGDMQTPAEWRVLIESLPPESTVVDLGANIGVVALRAAAAGHRVVAVEASPELADCLARSAQVNQLPVEVVQCAVSAAPGTVLFHPDGPWGQVVPSPPSDAADLVSVQARTFDDLVTSFTHESVALVKVDVEGCELDVLAGGQEVLSAPDAPDVFIESNAWVLAQSGHQPSQLVDALVALRYCVFEVYQGTLVPFDGTFQPRTVIDLFATKRPAVPAGWRTVQQWDPAQLLAVLVDESTTQGAPNRQHMAQTLQFAPSSMRSLPGYWSLVLSLAQDEDEDVRSAAAWAPRQAGSVRRARVKGFRLISRTRALSSKVAKAVRLVRSKNKGAVR
jgi:FkbM family methyltransferase